MNKIVTKVQQVDLRNHVVNYLGVSDAVGSNGNGSLWLIAVSADGTNAANYDMNITMLFYDS